MGALDGARAVDRDGGGDLRYLEVVDACGGANEVDNRVNGTDLVEVDGFDRHAMKFGFGLGHALEHAKSRGANLRGQFGFL